MLSSSKTNICEDVVAHWYTSSKTRIIPPSFRDADAERFFLQEYRVAGLGSLQYVCALGIAAYVAMGCVDVIASGWNPHASLRRLVAILILAATVLLIVTQRRLVLRHYSFLLGAFGAMTIIGLISVMHILREDSVKEIVNPVSLLALLIFYGFGRLPLKATALVGGVSSFFAMLGPRLTNMSAPGARTLIYLLLANAVGLLLARSIELRERRLFLQGRVAEEAQVELQRRTSHAESVSAEKTRLIAAVGHDLRQPMLAAVLHTEVLLQRLDARDLAGVHRQAARVEESVKIMGATLDHLITAARYDAGAVELEIQAVPVAEILHRLRELFEAQASAAGVEFRVNEPLHGLAVITDKTVLIGVLTNLVSNAIKFRRPRSDRPSIVAVRTFLTHDSCRITVSDNGIGIPKSELDGIWQPFYQVGNRERNRRKGLGLGLYIVKQSLARLAHHSVAVQSLLGRGTRFVVCVPAVIVEAATNDLGRANQDATPASPLKRLGGLHVLLIEDDQDAREAIEAQLAEWGAVCSAGYCLEQAMNACSQKKLSVDVILADFRLPGHLTGVDAICSARAQLGYEPRAVLVTAEVDIETMARLLPPNTVYLKKPFGGGELWTALAGPRTSNRFA